MDTITHGLFGLTLYGSVNKTNASVPMKRSLFFTALAGSQIPDIDVVANLTETGQIMQQMWHRGLTHSVFLIPVWAGLLYWISRWLFRVKDRRIFFLAMLAVFIHDTIDLFNAWGTGYFEPFSSIRITFGILPIVDLTIWGIILGGFILAKTKPSLPSFRVYRGVGAAILIYIALQSAQGFWIEYQAQDRYDQTELAADYIPGHFQVIGKEGERVEISRDTVWSEPQTEYTLNSDEKADLTPLFEQNPQAKPLYDWSPFVVIVNDKERLGIFDPRFYEGNGSFLHEYVEK
ncbi:metal-dependent hydrolase [Paludifilum halophilum]|uniref:Hydrolase n=1 Tax=Paludifilum halophilum TaxID=1642702 RepID=A0A235B6I5_9BACL|nr:metal-dependent hydrolase [Paludifilum halophilum]OYD07215.1 hydrolase [Paludifilum halophilum]